MISRKIFGSDNFLIFYTAFSTDLVYPTPPEQIDPESMGWGPDSDIRTFKDPKWFSAASSWLKVTPFGFRKLLNWVSEEYQKPIIVTENGFSDYLGNLDDMPRIYYYKHFINQMLKAVKIDGVDVRGYFAWSLMDNFEWAMGYS